MSATKEKTFESQMFGEDSDSDTERSNQHYAKKVVERKEVSEEDMDDEYDNLPTFKKDPAILAKIQENASKRKRSSSEESEDYEHERVPQNPATQKFEQVWSDVQKTLKPRKRGKGIAESSATDEMLSSLYDEMMKAAQSDFKIKSDKPNEPCLSKLKLLPKVRQVFETRPLWGALVEHEMLEVVRRWLEPLPDRSLPALEIRRLMFVTLESLPIDTDHLRSSGVGKVVMFYTKVDREIPELRAKAQALINKWTQPLLGRATNFRDARSRHVIDANEEHYAAAREREVKEQQERVRKNLELRTGERTIKKEVFGNELPSPTIATNDANAKPQEPERIHAQIPIPELRQFTVVPRSLAHPDKSRQSKNNNGKEPRFKNLKATIGRLKKENGARM